MDIDGTGVSVKRKREDCTVRGAVSGTCHGDSKGHRGQDRCPYCVFIVTDKAKCKGGGR